MWGGGFREVGVGGGCGEVSVRLVMWVWYAEVESISSVVYFRA